MVELQDANREVLVGKKQINCLSCGKGNEPVHSIKGRDNRLYKGESSLAAINNAKHTTLNGEDHSNMKFKNKTDITYSP